MTTTPWVFDGHNDLPTALRATAGYSVAGLDEPRPELHTDLPRLRRGGVGAQFWSAYTSSRISEPEAAVSVLEQIDAIRRLAVAYPDDLELAYTADDVERVRRAGRIASLIGVEGGHTIASSLGVLRALAALGIRYLTLTHNDNTSWADSATADPGVGGLDEDGRAVVRALNRHGVLVDLSHTSAETQRAALAIATAPVLFSHSSARAVADHPRNVGDDVLEALPGNGGVIQITFVPYFVSPALIEWTGRFRDQGFPSPGWTWPAAPRPSAEGADAAPAHAAEPTSPEVDAWIAAHPRPAVTIADVVAHIEHARDVAGVDHIGLGGDYDGVDLQPEGLEDVSGYPTLFAALAERGWSEGDLEKLAWRNVLRVLRDAEDAATEPLWPGA